MSPISVECGTRMDQAQNQPSHCDARSSGGLYTTDWLRVHNGDPSFFSGPLEGGIHVQSKASWKRDPPIVRPGPARSHQVGYWHWCWLEGASLGGSATAGASDRWLGTDIFSKRPTLARHSKEPGSCGHDANRLHGVHWARLGQQLRPLFWQRANGRVQPPYRRICEFLLRIEVDGFTGRDDQLSDGRHAGNDIWRIRIRAHPNQRPIGANH